MSDRPVHPEFNPFVLIRRTFPAIFLHGGRYFQEEFDIDNNVARWVEVDQELVHRWEGHRLKLTIVDEIQQFARTRAAEGA